MFYLEIDPQYHKLYDLPVAQSLRQDTRVPNIMSYYNEPADAWIIGLRSEDGRYIKELGMADGKLGKETCPDRRSYHEMLWMFRNMIGTADEEKRRLRGQYRTQAVAHAESQEQYRHAIMSMYRHVHRKHGAVKAERYLHGTGLSPQGPSVIH